MIEGINPEIRAQGAGMPIKSRPMTDEQRNTFLDILKNYDPQNMTARDRENLRSETRAAGIMPGEEMKTILEEAGFRAGPPEGMPPGGTSETELPDYLAEFVNKFRSGDADEDDLNNLLQQLYANGLTSSGNIVDYFS